MTPFEYQVWDAQECADDTKNGTRREVPLSEKALAVWSGGFGLSAGSISTMFKRYAEQAGIHDLTFHCLRRTAATRLAKKLSVLELCAMFGWRDPRMVIRHYYAADMEELARRLD